MAEFKVKISGMRRAVESAGEVATGLVSIESRIENVISALQLDWSVQEKIKAKLRTEVSNVEDAAQKLKVLSSTLSTIAGLYESTENRILGVDTSASGTGDSIQSIASDITDLADKCGIDSSSAYAGDPVNLCTGNYVYEKTCLELDSAMRLRFRMFYNIQNREKGALGLGWTHNWEVCLKIQDNRVRMQGEDASFTDFREDENHQYHPEPGSFGTLEKGADGYLLITRGQTAYRFDTAGKLLSMEDDAGSKIVVQYDENQRVQSVEDKNGQGFLFSYLPDGKLETVSDGKGRCVFFDYTCGQVTSVRDAMDRVTGYGYDKQGRLTELTGAKGISVLKNEYDEAGRTLRQTFADGGTISYEYRDADDQIVMTEQNGSRIVYEHDGRLRNTRNIYEDGEERFTYNDRDQRTSFTDKKGNTSYYEFDEKGNLSRFKNALNDSLQIIYTDRDQVKSVAINGTAIYQASYDDRHLQESFQNALGEKNSYEYNEKNQPVTWIRADGSEVRLTYDSFGNLASITNSMGGRTEYQYDARQRVTGITDALGNRTEYEYNDADEITRIRNAEGKIQSFDYDECGNVICTRDYNGAVTEITYNEINKPCKIKDCEGNETKLEYDICQNLVRRTAPDGGVTAWEYNGQHRLISVTDAEGNSNHMEYDCCGNVIRRTDPTGAVYSISYDALNRATAVTNPMGLTRSAKYDVFGNETEITYEDGRTERFTYDLAGRMTSRTDRMGWKTEYTYTPLGNVEQVSDANGVLESYEYYPGGLLKQYSKADGTSQYFTYDSNENVICVKDQNGGGWSFAYDCLGRVILAEQVDGIRESYEYDSLGNITAVTDGEGIRREYLYSKGGDLLSVTDGLGNETRYEYDACHRLIRILQPEEGHFDAEKLNAFNSGQQSGIRATSFCYDKEGHIIAREDAQNKRTVYTYDGNGNILSQTDADGMRTQSEYNPDGTRKSVSFADGRSVQMSYNAMQQLVQMEDWLGITRVVSDAAGRPLEVTDARNQTVAYEWGSRGECRSVRYPDGDRISYEYDTRGRLSAAVHGDDRVISEYAPGGFLKQKTFPGGVTSRYVYNRAGALTELCHSDRTGVLDRRTFEYDRAGLKTGETRFARSSGGDITVDTYRYCYSAAGSLTAVEKNGVPEENYRYDGFGNRIHSDIRGNQAEYGYNTLNQLVSLKDQKGEHTFTYDIRGNLTEEILNGQSVRTLRYGALDLPEETQCAGLRAVYEYNGLMQRTGRTVSDTQEIRCRESFVYDVTEGSNHLFSVNKDGGWRNLLWDQGIAGTVNDSRTSYFLGDERMTPIRQTDTTGSLTASAEYDTFGNLLSGNGSFDVMIGFTGYYLPDDVSGFSHAGLRSYAPGWGRFISPDPFPASAAVPLALNSYLYCVNDPVNRIDPTGAIWAWLAGGIVGAVANTAVKLAGDVVNSIASGENKMSSWQSYVGAAAGGFTSGTILMTTGNVVAAGAAGAAVETAVSDGLSVLTGAEGYTAADGYNINTFLGKLTWNTAKGAITGSIFKSASKYIKIPGITSGRGSFQAVWKQIVTKAGKGIIANVTGKTVLKGLVAYGGVKFLDQLLQKGGKKILTTVVEKITGYDLSNTEVTDFITSITSSSSDSSSQGGSAGDYLSSNAITSVNCSVA